jgi:release factor glutamine methyltransferase
LAVASLKSALRSAIGELTSHRVGSPRMNAELLLMFTLGCDRAYLYAHPERELSAEEQARYEEALKRRSDGVPAQYITGHQEFWGIDLIVSPAVLIPRPETEHLIERVLKISALSAIPPRRIVDVGTGSGCIALALARELPQAEIHATEISAAALEIAHANAARHQLDSRIQFHRADLLTGLPESAFDLVVSNPPYVGDEEEDKVELEVRRHEPRSAVFAGPRGIETIERLLPQAQRVLRPDGWVVLEISGTIAPDVRLLLTDWEDVQIGNDLQGIPRVASARKVANKVRG